MDLFGMEKSVGKSVKTGMEKGVEEIDREINESLMETAKRLTENGLTVTAAESLTGGMICASFVNIPGSSAWFSDGFVTYSDASKVRRIGVSEELIRRETAVSAGVAMEMARGALEKSGADFSVAVTGLAGPYRDEVGREPGLVYIAAAFCGGTVVKRFDFSGDRLDIRKKTNREAVRLLNCMVQILT